MGLTKDKHTEKSRVISILTEDGKFRLSAIQNTNVAKIAQKTHNLPPVPALLLARALSASSLLAVFLKGEERVILDAFGNGKVSKISAEAIQVGEVRGFVEYNDNIKMVKPEHFKSALGSGILRVLRILYTEPEPIIGIVELIQGDISSDLNYYFAKSEQIFSIALLDATVNTDGIISNSCGMIIQAMPGAKPQDHEFAMDYFGNFPPLSQLINSKRELTQILPEILPWKFSTLKYDQVDFFCRCSKKSFIDKLLTLNLDEIREMKKLDQRELVCQYCNTHYYLEDADFKIIENILLSKNN